MSRASASTINPPLLTNVRETPTVALRQNQSECEGSREASVIYTHTLSLSQQSLTAFLLSDQLHTACINLPLQRDKKIPSFFL